MVTEPRPLFPSIFAGWKKLIEFRVYGLGFRVRVQEVQGLEKVSRGLQGGRAHQDTWSTVSWALVSRQEAMFLSQVRFQKGLGFRAPAILSGFLVHTLGLN